MLGVRLLFATLVIVSTWTSCLASDNSKSKIIPDQLFSSALLSSPGGDGSGDQVANLDPKDPNYLDSLKAQLKQQQAQVLLAQRALNSAQTQLANARQSLALAKQLYNSLQDPSQFGAVNSGEVNGVTYGDAINSLARAKENFAHGYGSAAIVAQAQTVVDILKTSGFANGQSMGLEANQMLVSATNLVGTLMDIIAAEQVALARAQAAVAQTQALIDAATGQTGQTTDAGNSTDQTASAVADQANAVADAQGAADTGGAAGGD